MSFFKVSPGDIGWDVFSLDYHVDGPISTVSMLQFDNANQQVFKLTYLPCQLSAVSNNSANSVTNKYDLTNQLETP